MAAARQKEMNESMTVVATTTRTRPGVFVTSRFIKPRPEETAKLAPQCYSTDRKTPPFLTFPISEKPSCRERRPEAAKIGGERSASGPRLRCFPISLLPERRNLGPLALHFLRSHIFWRFSTEWRRTCRLQSGIVHILHLLSGPPAA